MKKRLILFVLVILTVFATPHNPAGLDPVVHAQSGVCDSWWSLCEEAAETRMDECMSEPGAVLGACLCVQFREHNKCMSLIGCDGYPEAFMIFAGCGPD